MKSSTKPFAVNSKEVELDANVTTGSSDGFSGAIVSIVSFNVVISEAEGVSLNEPEGEKVFAGGCVFNVFEKVKTFDGEKVLEEVNSINGEGVGDADSVADFRGVSEGVG